MISKLCYELYKVDWKHSHMITKEREMDSIKNYYEDLVDDDTEYTYNDYLEEFGYDGELYVCYEEFLENEYLETNYIRYLLDNDRLFKLYLEDLWSVSGYNEDGDCEIEYYINENDCKVSSIAYLYSYEDDCLMEMKIAHIIKRTDDIKFYDKLLENEDVLIDGEDKYNANTSAEFITDNNCYLVWFKYA